jgi:probable rRNA maturation factor
MTLDLNIQDRRWHPLDLAALADAACDQTLSHLGQDPDNCDISLLACDDARIAVLNRQFRARATPTNVLSWPAEELAAERAGDKPGLPAPDIFGEIFLGDIAIAWDTSAREAAAAGRPMHDHVTHLVVHGVLHLLGYDHIRDPDATLMQQLEVAILGKMGIDNPY